MDVTVSSDLLDALLAVALRQGETAVRAESLDRRATEIERRLAAAESGLAGRLAELEATNDELRACLILANGVLGEIKRACERGGWSEATGLTALEWLDHVLALGTADGWPSLN